MQTGGVGSKYDDYWAAQLPQIRAQVQAAASAGLAAMRVPGLTRLGARQSWHGTADVLGQEVAGASGAHARSLGNTVAASGICRPWPGRAFRFTVSAAGDMLTTDAWTEFWHTTGFGTLQVTVWSIRRDRRPVRQAAGLASSDSSWLMPEDSISGNPGGSNRRPACALAEASNVRRRFPAVRHQIS